MHFGSEKFMWERKIRSSQRSGDALPLAKSRDDCCLCHLASPLSFGHPFVRTLQIRNMLLPSRLLIGMLTQKVCIFHASPVSGSIFWGWQLANARHSPSPYCIRSKWHGQGNSQLIQVLLVVLVFLLQRGVEQIQLQLH